MSSAHQINSAGKDKSRKLGTGFLDDPPPMQASRFKFIQQSPMRGGGERPFESKSPIKPLQKLGKVHSERKINPTKQLSSSSLLNSNIKPKPSPFSPKNDFDQDPPT